MKGRLTYRSVARSHTGLVRRHNEDAFLERPDLGLWVVADGMGGMTAGEVASKAIVQALDAVPSPLTGASFVAEIRARLARVNADLRALAASRATTTAIGSTVAGLMVFADHFACFWAGDSRVYRLRDHELSQLTRDHTLVQEMIDAGVLTPQQAQTHPYASIINHAVGVDDALHLEFTHARIQPGDIFLLCSDGLTRMVSDTELADDMGHLALDHASDTLLARVLSRGARDNVTLILVACLPTGAKLDPL